MFRDKKPEQEKRKSMAKKVTMEDIARELRVSKSLVSKALSGKYNVNSEIRLLKLRKNCNIRSLIRAQLKVIPETSLLS